MSGRTVNIGNVVLGEGLPKICVPITAGTQDMLLEQAVKIAGCPEAEIVEWRADCYRMDCSSTDSGQTDCGHADDYAGAGGPEEIRQVLSLLKGKLHGAPVLFTYRGIEEGGSGEASAQEYEIFVQTAIECGADAVDIELSRGGEVVRRLVKAAKNAHIPTILSSHDFEKTPSAEVMRDRLLAMQELGADICKLAVMPKTPGDVLTLLETTCRLKEERPDMLLITMSMSPLGALSRVCGRVCGSVLTFGTVGAASAPGQLEAGILKQILNVL